MNPDSRPHRLLDAGITVAALLCLVSALWGWFWAVFTLDQTYLVQYVDAEIVLAFVALVVLVAGAASVRWLPVSRWVRGVWLGVLVVLAVAAVLTGSNALGAPRGNPGETGADQAILITLICPTLYPLVMTGLVAGAMRLTGSWSRGPRSPRARSSARARRWCAGR